MLFGNLAVKFNGWHTWRWAFRPVFERDAMWLTLLPYRGRGFRFLFWHFCELAPCTCRQVQTIKVRSRD